MIGKRQQIASINLLFSFKNFEEIFKKAQNSEIREI